MIPDIKAVRADDCQYNLEDRIFIDSDGTTYPIVKMMDENMEDTEEPDCCVAFVAGEGEYFVAVIVDEEQFK